MVLERATQLGTDIDAAIKSIKHDYDAIGRQEIITSYSNDDGTGTVENQVVLSFNQLSQATQSWQSHQGAAVTVGMGQSPSVIYSYDATVSSDVFTNGHRLKDTTYPSGRVIFNDYGTAGEINDLLHRVKRIRETDGSGTILVEYSHNGGGGMPVVVDYQTPHVKLDLYQGTTGTYAGLDRFGQLKDVYWKGYSGTSDVDRFKYEYNYSKTPNYRDIDSSIYASNDKDQAYTHDSLDHLETLKQGTLSGSTISGTPAAEQDWTLDGAGNWTGYVEKSSGSTVLNQTRTNNKVNEITGISAGTGDNWYDPTFDAAGNMRTGPKPGMPKDSDANGRKLRNTWDAWNRLVKVEVSPTNANSWTDVITCEYDGLSRRIVKVDKTGMSDITYDYYYDGQQVVETRKDADSDPLEQFVWHPYYIDGLAVRYYDSDTDGSGIAVHYFTHDENQNIASIVSSSGTVVERYEYRAFGAVQVLDANFSADSDGQSDIGNGTLYSGRLLDAETGYYFYRARFHDPGLGRFLSRDPVDGDSNVYRYVANMPFAFVDPYGLMCQELNRISRIDTPAADYLPRPIMLGPIPITIKGQFIVEYGVRGTDCDKCCANGQWGKEKVLEAFGRGSLQIRATAGVDESFNLGDVVRAKVWGGLQVQGNFIFGGSLMSTESTCAGPRIPPEFCIRIQGQAVIRAGFQVRIQLPWWSWTTGVQAYGIVQIGARFCMTCDAQGCRGTRFVYEGLQASVGFEVCVGLCYRINWGSNLLPPQ